MNQSMITGKLTCLLQKETKTQKHDGTTLKSTLKSELNLPP
jgi:hypothetical protein